jgi:hypothetical protein
VGHLILGHSWCRCMTKDTKMRRENELRITRMYERREDDRLKFGKYTMSIDFLCGFALALTRLLSAQATCTAAILLRTGLVVVVIVPVMMVGLGGLSHRMRFWCRNR